MTWLPRYLDAWRPRLADLDDPLWLSLESLAASIGEMVGSRGIPLESTSGEFDGYDGLCFRGPVDRLQVSEWATATALPIEFLRRAAQNELQFLRPRRVVERRAGRTIVLVDTGPDQLGAARVGQLACLLALCRRAEEAGVEFAWCPVGDPVGKVHTGFAPASAETFLAARSLAVPTRRTVSAWLERTAPSEPDDIWWVGGRGLAALAPPSANGATIVPDLGSGDGTLEVEISTATRHRVRRLRLPPEREQVRLLRDPFELARPAPVASRHKVVGASASFAGVDRVLVRASATQVRALHVPDSTGERRGRTRWGRAGDGDYVLAAGVMSRKVWMLVLGANGELALLRGRPESRPWRVSFAQGIPPMRRDDDRLLGLQQGVDGRLYLLDGTRPWVSHQALTAHGRPDGELVCFFNPYGHVADWSPRNKLAIVSEDLSVQSPTLRVLERVGIGPDVERARFSVDGLESCTFGDQAGRVICTLRDSDRVTVVGPGTNLALRLPDGTRLIGCSAPPGRHARVLVIDTDGRSVAEMNQRTMSTVTRVPWRIANAVLAPDRSRLALVGDRGQLAVWSLRWSQLIYTEAASDGRGSVAP